MAKSKLEVIHCDICKDVYKIFFLLTRKIDIAPQEIYFFKLAIQKFLEAERAGYLITE